MPNKKVKKGHMSAHTLVSIGRVASDIEFHLEQALTVMDVAQQRFAGAEEEVLGVLDLIECKVRDIQNANEEIWNLSTRCGPIEKLSTRQPNVTSK